MPRRYGVPKLQRRALRIDFDGVETGDLYQCFVGILLCQGTDTVPHTFECQIMC
jgi:hypothetical protein